MSGKQKTKKTQNKKPEEKKQSDITSEARDTDPADSSDIGADSENTIAKEANNINASADEASFDQATDLVANTEKADERTEEVVSDETPPQNRPKRSFRISFTGNNIVRVLRIICIIGFVIFAVLFINETVIQPYRTKRDINHTRDLYHKSEEEVIAYLSPTPASTPTPTPVPEAVDVTPIPTPIVTEAPTPTPDPNRDEQGRLLQFQELLEQNGDVKGWITIPDTNVDYVVMQSGEDDPEFYLDKGFDKEYSKAGSLFLDINTPVDKKNYQNLVIHGHNMVSTKEKMFHNILKYKKDINYYREHPLIQFDTIYQTGSWKVFAVFITPPNPSTEDFFEFRKSTFKCSSDFLNFVYQIRIRSLINVDAVDINEHDQLLMLSTCSYEVNDDYRSIVVARKVREGEELTVDVDRAKMNKKPYYAKDYREKYGKKVPDVAATFEEALEKGQISWYTPVAVQ